MASPKHLFAAFDVSRQVFFKSALSLGIVNLKPLLPGHVLILPQRVVPRLSDLSAQEVSDLFLSVQTVGKVIESAYGGEALTVSLQDGKAAGQSVPHVHIHIIPRRSSDFGGNNDSVYPAIEKHEGELEGHHERATEGRNGASGVPTQSKWRIPPDDERKPRSAEEMAEEAQFLARLFSEDIA